MSRSSRPADPPADPTIAAELLRRVANEEERQTSLRDDAANTVAFICAKFGAAYPSIQPRLTRTLLRALLDTKPLSTHYGAIKGLHALGPKVVRETVMPNLRAYLNTLEPLLEAPAPSDKKALDAMSEEERNTTVAKEKLAHIRPVSYTHLTLPTILLV